MESLHLWHSVQGGRRDVQRSLPERPQAVRGRSPSARRSSATSWRASRWSETSGTVNIGSPGKDRANRVKAEPRFFYHSFPRPRPDGDNC